jgi:hypothetical protein
MGQSKAFDTALTIIEAEIIAEKTKPIEKPKPSTQIIDMVNILVLDKQTLLDLDGEGVLEKLLLRSPSSSFSITLTTEKISMQGSYTHFQDVCAYQEDDTYVLELTNIEFKQHLRLVLTVAESITFSKIFIKYAIKD